MAEYGESVEHEQDLLTALSSSAYSEAAMDVALVQGYLNAVLQAGGSLDKCYKSPASRDTRCTLLSLAATNNHNDLLRTLVQAGSHVNFKFIPDPSTGSDKTALHFAVINDHEESVRTLLELGADVNVEDSQGFTPLLEASLFREQTQIVKLLIQHGANVNAAQRVFSSNASMFPEFLFPKDTHRSTITDQIARRVGHSPHFLNEWLMCPLLYAVDLNKVQLVRLLIQGNCDVDFQRFPGVLKRGNVGIRSKDLQSALTTAVSEGYLVIARMLLDAGCDASVLNTWVREDSYPSKKSNIRQWITNETCSTTPLKQMCRNKIRRTLHSCDNTYIGRLPLPNSLLNYLMFQDL